MFIKHPQAIKNGYYGIVDINRKHPEMLMDFGLLKLDAGDEFADR